MLALSQPPLADRARWAVALYVNSWDFSQGAAHARDRRAGIRRYKNAPAARLRADLEPVLMAYPDGTVQYSAAAYVLARYSVDTERNAARLFDSGRMDRKPFNFDSADPLPEALADLWVVRRSPTALHRLVDMPSDGHIGEEQRDSLARVFAITPDAVLRVASKSPTGWSQLVSGGTDGPLPKVSHVHEKALLDRLRRDAKREQ